MIKKLIIYTVILFLTFSVNNIFAQVDKNGGSLYSIFGLGELNYSTGSRTEAMGIMGISLYGNYANNMNPAAWTKIPNTIIHTKFDLENIRSTDGTNTAKRTFANFEGFNLLIPFNTGNGWIFNAGLNTYSQMNYDVTLRRSSDGEYYNQSYSGNGGLSRLNLGFSYIIFKYLSFGFQFNYLFGNLNKSDIIDFDNTAFFDTRNSFANSITGINFNGGLIFHGFGKLFKNKKLDNLSIGGFISTPAKLTSNLTSKYSLYTGIDSISVAENHLKIPLAFGFGISNTFSNNIVIAADIFMQQWDNYKIQSADGSEVHPAEIQNNFKAGLGFEYTPSKKYEAPFFQRVSYRLGASYLKDYLRLYDKSIISYIFSAGLSLPIGRFNSLDLTFSYKMRGTTSNGLIKDDVLRLSAAINIGELWFIKPNEDY